MTGPRRAAVRLLVAVAAVVLGLLPAGCAGPTTPNGPTTPTGAAVPQPTADPNVVLSEQADRARTLAEQLTADMPAQRWDVLLDEKEPCVLGTTQDWPRSWLFVHRTTDLTDPVAEADRVVTRLTADGWILRTPPPLPTQTTRRLQRDGVMVSVTTAVGPSVLQLEVMTPCVRADGTLDRRVKA